MSVCVHLLLLLLLLAYGAGRLLDAIERAAYQRENCNLEHARRAGEQDADAALPYRADRFHAPELQQQYQIGYGQVTA